MARIPRIPAGQARLSTQSTQATRTAGTTGRNLQVAGQALSKVALDAANKLDEARDFSEIAQARLLTTEGMADQLVTASTATSIGSDGNPHLSTGRDEDYIPFRESTSELRERVSGLFSNSDTRDRFLAGSFDLAASVNMGNIKKKFTENMINEGQATVERGSNSLAEQFAVTGQEFLLKSGNPKVPGIEELWNDAVIKGFYDADVAQKAKGAALDSARKKAFRFDLTNNPDFADKRLKQGFYKFDAQEKNEARKAQQQAVTTQNIDTRYTLLDGISDGTIDFTNVDTFVADQAVKDPKLAEAIARNVKTFKVSGKENKAFMKVVNSVFEGKDPKQISDFLVNTLNDNPNISRDRLAMLVKASKARSISLDKEQKNSPLDAAFKIIKDSVLEAAFVPIAMLGLLEKVGDPTIQPEQLPDIAKEQVEKQIINQNPNKTLYKVDDFITTPSGLVQVTGYDEDGEPLVKRVNK